MESGSEAMWLMLFRARSAFRWDATLGVDLDRGVKMTRIRVESFAISLDGYGAGPNQDINNPLGAGGTELHQWAFPTRTLQRILLGADSGATGIDDDFAARTFRNVGAWILGRNMLDRFAEPGRT